MSVFSPMDVRGPDQRRKQLIQKLMQHAHGGRGHVPMPPRAGGFMNAAGHAFAGGRVSHVKVTQHSNILPSILAKLGIGGQGLGEEVSAGPGMPVAPPVPVMPIQPGGPNAPAAPVPGAEAPPASTFSPGANQPYDPAPPVQSAPDAGPADSGLVPLGGGLYYDPTLNTIHSIGDVGGGGAGGASGPKFVNF